MANAAAMSDLHSHKYKEVTQWHVKLMKRCAFPVAHAQAPALSARSHWKPPLLSMRMYASTAAHARPAALSARSPRRNRCQRKSRIISEPLQSFRSAAVFFFRRGRYKADPPYCFHPERPQGYLTLTRLWFSTLKTASHFSIVVSLCATMISVFFP